MDAEKRYTYFGGYWTDTLTGERQPSHTYDRALFGLGPAGGPYHTEDCPGCAWLVNKNLGMTWAECIERVGSHIYDGFRAGYWTYREAEQSLESLDAALDGTEWLGMPLIPEPEELE